MSVAGSDLNARQRRHVHMTSTIFSADGPSNKSLYVVGRQQELYEQIRPNLRENNQIPPDLSLPAATDVRCTQNAGHGAVWTMQADDQVMKTPRTIRTTGPDYVVYDGVAKPVVRAAKDPAAIPKEFWATSVNLQWHDTRNETCRQKGAGSQAGMSADQMKRHHLSSEIFGKERLLQASTAERDLQPETRDNMKLDSQQLGRAQPNDASPNARERFQLNLSKSTLNTIPTTHGVSPVSPRAAAPINEDPANVSRRRSEKNFSDLFGAQMGERQATRGKREEILGARNCYFLDSRSEIASRNKEHWKHEEGRSASDRKQAEGSSQLFDRSSPTKQPPPLDAEQHEARKLERGCWESKDSMEIRGEISRRRREKDFQKDFNDAHGQTHQTRRQRGMASDGVGGVFGGTPAAAWASRSPRSGGYPGAGGASPRAPALSQRTAKDTKLASLQSSIFS